MTHRLTTDDVLAITDLKARYFRYVDDKRWDQLPELFTDDAHFGGFAFDSSGTTADFVSALSAFLNDTHSEHRGTMPRLRMVDANTVRAVWTMSDYVTWEPDSRVYKNVPIEGMYGIRGYGLYEEEYLRTPAGWRISFSRLVRTRIDPLVGTPAPDPGYELNTQDTTWLDG
ncbi:nuclear transport factor 2 family protein [Arthrobacter sp. KNU40]|uniref:nuclear transport factor 2 family protein n=1 Tax=Arthrobacter sp. KNU40 TaxID=3447965 RepID=UPI003F61A50F